MTNDTRERDLHDAIMNLIRVDLASHDLSSMSDLPTYQLINRVMYAASTDLTAALSFTTPDRPYYFSDSVYDEISLPTQTIAVAHAALADLFNSDDVTEPLIESIDELITMILPDLDDMIDDDEYLPTSIADLISLYTDDNPDV